MMTQVVQAIYEDGVLRPLEKLDLGEHQQVQIVIQSGKTVEPGRNSERDEPLEGIRCATGISDLAEHFDDYRLGHRSK
jgi:predicted DNA-binding antitoxin AbrB/MazE fold protein